MSDYENYAPAAVQAFTLDPSRETDVLKQAAELRIGVASNDQEFSAIHTNREFDETGRAFVRLNSLFGQGQNVDQQYIASQYAAAFQETPYLGIDLPGHGKSDRLTKEQREDMNNSGSIDKIADAHVEAALDIMPNLQDAIVTGEALGVAFAAAFATRAAYRGINVRYLFGFDPVGMEQRMPAQLFGGYVAAAIKSRFERRKPADEQGEQELEDAFSEHFVDKIKKLGPTDNVSIPDNIRLVLRNGPRYMIKKSPFSRPTALASLERALDLHPELKAFFVFGGRSVVGRLTREVGGALDYLDLKSGGRVGHDLWPYDNQDIGLARHQPRDIKYIKDHIEQS